MADQAEVTSEQGAAQTTGQDQQAATAETTSQSEVRLSQAEVDRIVAQRLYRDRSTREAEKSEAEKLAERATAAETARAEAEAKLAEAEAKLAAMERRLNFRAAAAASGAPETVLDDAWAAYPADAEVSTEAVAEWLKARPHFGPSAQTTPSTRGAAGRGGTGESQSAAYSDRLRRWGYQ